MNIKNSIVLVISTILLASCAKEENIQLKNSYLSQEVSIRVPSFISDDNGTKTAIANDGTISWASGDCISVFPTNPDPGQTSSQVKFQINSTGGSSTATFVGSGWGMYVDGSREYVACYPYSSLNTDSNIPVTYIDNMEQGSINTLSSNLYKNDFMVSEKIIPESESEAVFNFKHLGCLVEFKLTVPSDAYSGVYFTSAVIEAPTELFIKEGTYNSFESNPTIMPSSLSKTITVSWGGKVQSAAKITPWVLMAPISFDNTTINITAYTTKGKYVASKTLTLDMQAGKKYTITATLARSSDTPATPKFVDFGTGVQWANINLGATYEYEPGYSYAWGEVDQKDKWTPSTYTRWGTSESSTPPLFGMGKYTGTATGGDGRTILEKVDDAATVLWGNGTLANNYMDDNSGIRIPSIADFEALMNNTDRIWECNHGIYGLRITGKGIYSKSSIFIPAIGLNTGTSMSLGGTSYYWTRDLKSSPVKHAHFFQFSSDDYSINSNNRYYGLCVRAVKDIDD